MKQLIFIISVLVSSTGFGQTLKDTIEREVMSTIFNHLDKIGVDHPKNIQCINDAANHQATYMEKNYVIGHGQFVEDIGDTIIFNHYGRVYFFCDTNYAGDGEICVLGVFKDTADLIQNVGQRVLDLWLSSPPHKECLEMYHEFYGISIRIQPSPRTNQILAWGTVVYGKRLVLGRPRYPKHFSVNRYAESNYRKEHDSYIVIK